MDKEKPARILSPREVVRRTSLSRTTLWRMCQPGARDRFPAPITLTCNRIGWWEADVEAWMAARKTRGAAR